MTLSSVTSSAKGDDADAAVQESVLDEKAAGDEAGPSDEKEVDEEEVDEGKLPLCTDASTTSLALFAKRFSTRLPTKQLTDALWR